MASKVITISLPEALEWKLSELNRQSGIPKSTLIAKALLLLVSEFNVYHFKGGESGRDFSLEDIEEEYAKRIEDGKTTKANS